MSKLEKASAPLSRRTVSRSIEARAALRDNAGSLSTRLFVAGKGEAPTVKTKIIPVNRIVAGRKVKHYEVQVEVNGVLLGERASAPPLLGKAIKDRIPIKDLAKHEKLLAAFAPDHLPVDPHPRRLLKPFRRIPARLDRKLRYNTTVFSPDERQVFQDTSYPWSAFGRCETNFGPFSGVLIGPRNKTVFATVKAPLTQALTTIDRVSL